MAACYLRHYSIFSLLTFNLEPKTANSACVSLASAVRPPYDPTYGVCSMYSISPLCCLRNLYENLRKIEVTAAQSISP